MVTKAKGLLTPAQRTRLLSLDKLTSEEFKSYFSFSAEDIEVINRHRGRANRMGFGTQLCLVRYPGIAFSDDLEIPRHLLDYIGAQLNIPVSEFKNYGKGKNTLFSHLTEICTYYNYQEFTSTAQNKLIKFLENAVTESFDELYLMQLSIHELRKQRVLLPNLVEIERLIFSIKSTNETNLYKKITSILTEEQKVKIDQLLVIGVESKKSKLAWLKDISGKSNKDAALEVCYRIQTIKHIGLRKRNVNFVHENRLGQLANVAERYDSYDFNRFNADKRYALLTAFLAKYHQVLIDHLINIHTRILLTIKRSGQNAAKELQRSTGERANELLKHYVQLIETIAAARSSGENVLSKIENVLNWDHLLAEAEQAKCLVQPKRFSYMDLIKKKASYLRGYVPVMLEVLDLNSKKTDDTLLAALDHITFMSKESKRKVSTDISLDFVKKKWKPLVQDKDGLIDRSFFELTAATELTDRLRSGEIFEHNSVMYRELDDYLVDPAIMTGSLTIPDTFEEYITSRSTILDEKLKK